MSDQEEKDLNIQGWTVKTMDDREVFVGFVGDGKILVSVKRPLVPGEDVSMSPTNSSVKDGIRTTQNMFTEETVRAIGYLYYNRLKGYESVEEINVVKNEEDNNP